MNKDLKKVLIIRFSSIGDIVLTSPVIRCLKQQKPEIEIHYLTKAAYYPLISQNPHLSKIHLFDGQFSTLLNQLKLEKFDLIIDLHKNLRSLRFKLRLNIKSIGFNKLNWEKWLWVNLKKNLLPQKHLVDRYFNSLARIGVNNDNSGLDYFIPQSEEYRLNTLPEPFQNGYITIVLGALHFTKKFPVSKIINILNGISYPAILLGGKDEFDAGNQIMEHDGIRTLNLCGKLTINQSASLIKNADAVISNDTGLMHIAAAFRKKIFSVWGNTVPGFGMYPYYGQNSISHPDSFIFETEGLSCRPCSKIGYDKCPKGHFKCMNGIDEEKIVNKMTELL